MKVQDSHYHFCLLLTGKMTWSLNCSFLFCQSCSTRPTKCHQWLISCLILLNQCVSCCTVTHQLFSPAESPGQDFVTLDYRLRYYPSITYAVIGSAIIFVLVVALLALVLHHQRKRSVLLPRSGSHPHSHQPLLLSRLVIVDRGAQSSSPSAHFSSAHSLQLLTSSLYPQGAPLESPPSYSQAVLDVR